MTHWVIERSRVHALDLRVRGPSMKPTLERVERVVRALRFSLDRSVLTIPDPPTDPEPLGFVRGGGAEVHALHAPAHDEALRAHSTLRLSTASRPRVLSTRSAVAQPRRAFAAPYSVHSSSSTACASESITSVAPFSTALRTAQSGRSSRSGPPFTSSRVPVATAASITTS